MITTFNRELNVKDESLRLMIPIFERMFGEISFGLRGMSTNQQIQILKMQGYKNPKHHIQ